MNAKINKTTILCPVEGCSRNGFGSCKAKVIMLGNEGNCLSREMLTGKDAADGAVKDAAERGLMYGA